MKCNLFDCLATAAIIVNMNERILMLGTIYNSHFFITILYVAVWHNQKRYG